MEHDKQKPDLELTEDFTFEQREWKVQRIAWLIMALVVTLGLLGLFGPGPLSSRTLTSSDGALRLEYNRFERYQASSLLRLQFHTGDQGKARLWVNREFLDNVKLDSIVPPPERVEVRNGGFVYTFSVPRGERASTAFHLETEKLGANPLRLRLNDGPLLEAPHWVYP